MSRRKRWVSFNTLTIALMMVLGLLFSSIAFAQEARLEELNYKIEELYKQGKYREAIPLAKEFLKIAEQTYGPDHPNVAGSLNNLAVLYEKQGRYGQAEPLNKRTLAILEKAHGPDHPHVETSRNNLAQRPYPGPVRPGRAEDADSVWDLLRR